MKNVHEIFERAYGTCEIVEAYTTYTTLV